MPLSPSGHNTQSHADPLDGRDNGSAANAETSAATHSSCESMRSHPHQRRWSNETMNRCRPTLFANARIWLLALMLGTLMLSMTAKVTNAASPPPANVAVTAHGTYAT